MARQLPGAARRGDGHLLFVGRGGTREETAARDWVRRLFPDDGILGEEFGLIGVGVVMALFVLFVVAGWRIAMDVVIARAAVDMVVAGALALVKRTWPGADTTSPT